MGGPRWAGVAAWRSAAAGGVRGESWERPAESGELAGRAGTERRCPGAGEREPARSPRGRLARAGKPTLRSAVQPTVPAGWLPALSWESEARGPGKSQRRWPERAWSWCFCRRLRVGSLWWHLLPSGHPPSGPLALRQGSALSRGSQRRGPAPHSSILSVGCCFPQRPASIPNLRGQAKATSLQSLDWCSELLRSPAGPSLSSRRPQPLALAPAASFLFPVIPGFSGPLGACLSLLHPKLPLSSFLLSSGLPSFPSFFSTPITPPPPLGLLFFFWCPPNSLSPTLSLPTTRPLPSQLYPNLFLFSPASPHHEFPLSVPRFPVSSPPTAPRVPGAWTPLHLAVKG